MTTAASTIIQRVHDTLQDVRGVRWSAPELVRYLNDGQRAVAVARPDATSTLEVFVTTPGVRQELPDNAMSLIDIPRNNTGTKRVIRKTDMELLEAVSPDWASETPVSEFIHFMYDPREPNHFYLYPPAIGGDTIQLVYSAAPLDVAVPLGVTYDSVVGNISLKDQWGTALQNYILGRAYAKDAEYGGNAEASLSYMAAFSSALGVQLQASSTVAPKE